MAGLPASGQLTFEQIGTELGISTSGQHSLRAMSALAGKSTPDSVEEFYSYSHIPSAPSSVTTTMAFVIRCNWTDNSGNETGFRIQWSINGGAYGNTHTVSANSTSANLPIPCVEGTTYRAKVQSFNGVGNSSYITSSNEATGDGTCPS